MRNDPFEIEFQARRRAWHSLVTGESAALGSGQPAMRAWVDENWPLFVTQEELVAMNKEKAA